MSTITSIGLTIDESIKLWQNFNYLYKVQDIKVRLQLLESEINKKEYFIHECMRLQMEYSIIMNKIIPIPDKLYQKNQQCLDENFDNIIKDLNPKLDKIES